MVVPSGSSSVLHLAKLVLRAAAAGKHKNGKVEEASACPTVLASRFQELTSAISATNPPLTMPRVPKAFVPTVEQEQRLQRIETRAAASLLNIMPAEQQHTSEQPQQQRPPPLEEANQTYGATPSATIHTLLDVIYPITTNNNNSSSSRTTSAAAAVAAAAAGKIFVDAGSGMGIPTLVAALSNRFAISRGIEYERNWHDQAIKLQQAYQKEQQSAL
jgi:hypothetical protein